MGIWMRALGALLGLLLAGDVFAENVYMCEQNGHKIFSQTPCGEGAKVQNVGEKTVVVAVDMPHDDITYFCRVVLRAWDQAGVASQNPVYYNNGYYRYRGYGGGTDAHERVRTYILSHVANLEQLAREEPNIYQAVLNTASSYSYNGESRKYEYAADRGGAEVNCVQHFETMMQQIAQRRFEADQRQTKQLFPHPNH